MLLRRRPFNSTPSGDPAGDRAVLADRPMCPHATPCDTDTLRPMAKANARKRRDQTDSHNGAHPPVLYSTNTWLAFAIAQKYYASRHYVWCTPHFDPRSMAQ